MLNKIQKGKKDLIILGVFLSILTVICIVGAILCIVGGAINQRWWLYIIGALLLILGLIGICVCVTFLWTAFSLKATKGNLKEGNIPLENGTINAKRCANCGADVKDGDEFCPTCGKPTSNKKICANCNAENDATARVCTKCGQELE